MQIEVSIIIPSYNSASALEKNLPYLLENRKQLTGGVVEVIIVDDGSHDKNATKVISEKNNCTYLRLERNLGKGAAVRAGMIAANGKYRIFTDADIPYQIENISAFVSALRNNEGDMVVGDRTLNKSTYFEEISFLRKYGSKFFAFIVGSVISGKRYDTQCGLKGFKANVANDLFKVSKINGFALDVELFYIAKRRAYTIKCLPVQLRSTDGNSVSVFKQAIKMSFDLPKIIFYHFRIKS